MKKVDALNSDDSVSSAFIILKSSFSPSRFNRESLRISPRSLPRVRESCKCTACSSDSTSALSFVSCAKMFAMNASLWVGSDPMFLMMVVMSLWNSLISEFIAAQVAREAS